MRGAGVGEFRGSQATIFYEQEGQGPDIVWVAGGGSRGSEWQRYQTPHFSPRFRNTTFDSRGIGQTTCDVPMPWPIEDFARDTAELIREVCEPPVAIIGSSFGSAIVQQVCIDAPELLACAVVMGTGAYSTGWGWDFQEAEIEFRRAGGTLDGMMGVTHYAAMLYPARVLGDRERWPEIRDDLLRWMDSGDNETSLIPQWEASLRFDQREALPNVRVPLHVLAFNEDIQAPPQDGEELAELVPGAELHLFQGMGHGSWYGHTHDVLNPFIEELITRHL
jgi:pimeloyl-ACP methyl ester carboxylesterase